MQHPEFGSIIEKQLQRCADVLITKAKEYATEDRLHNFKVASKILHITPKQALAGFMAKHTVSIYDMIQSGNQYPIEVWDEKITDHINYLLILRAMIEEDLADGKS